MSARGQRYTAPRSAGRYTAAMSNIPARYNFARDVLDQLDPEALALWWISSDGGEAKLTFGAIAEQSRQVCNLLSAAGIGRGDTVVVLLPRIVEWWILNIACLRLGAIISPGPAQLTRDDIEYRLRRSSATCVICTPDVAPRVDAALRNLPATPVKLVVNGTMDGWESFDECVGEHDADFATADTAADETAAIYFTSGTSGPPKMAAHTHTSYPLRHAVTGTHWLDLHRGDLHWNLSDTGWAKAGWSSLYGPWNQGAAVFAVDAPRFNAVKTAGLLADYPIVTMCAAPTVYRSILLDSPGALELHSLRHCVAAGEPLNAEVVEAWREATGVTILDGYGQTETSLLVANTPGVELRPGSMGHAVPGYDVQVIDDRGNVLPTGQEGDIALQTAPQRPLGLFKEYWDDPEATAAAFRGDWFVTGDRAYVDDDGYFWFVGRADDVIITSGYRVGPFEVESALLAHDAVAESAVVSSPDEVRGEVVKAFVVLKPGYAASDELVVALQEHTKDRTAPYKYPRKIEFVEALPKTTTGKCKRAELRAAEWAAAPGN